MIYRSEEWRDIPGYEGIYQASSLGNIRTCEGKTTYTERSGVRRWKQRILKQKVTRNRYNRADARVSLWKNGKEKTWLVARLVGLAWCDGFLDGLTINHKNGNPLDNRAVNLEWITRSENIKKGYDDGLYASIQKPVLLIEGNNGYGFRSMAEANVFLGRNHGYITNCVKTGRPITGSDGVRYRLVVDE